MSLFSIFRNKHPLWVFALLFSSLARAEGAVADANPYGLSALWQAGDFVAKGTLLILVLMSIGSWYITALKFIEQRQISRQARQTQGDFWGQSDISQAVGQLDQDSTYRFVAESGVQALQHHRQLHAYVDLNEWLQLSIVRSTDAVQSRLQNGLPFLATVGATAPFVGLFGTVWGIYHALTEIGISGQASIDRVAGPVGESLIMTAIGLAVAVPAVLGYNWLVRRNKTTLESVRLFGYKLHTALLGNAAHLSNYQA